MPSTCYICPSDRFVDDHHYDCLEGKLSPETVPLCRRCHRTYHIWGVDWFEDEYLDKIIEIENKKREIWKANNYGRVQLPMTRADVHRSDYWNKTHGIKSEKPVLKAGKAFPSFVLPHGEPLCGWDWVNEHMFDLIDWVPRIEITEPNFNLVMDIDNMAKLKEFGKILRGRRQHAKEEAK